MTPTSRPLRHHSLRLAVLATAASAVLAGGAGPAAAAPKEPASYVALGDSYASGFGAGSYVNACRQSPLGLPGLLDNKKQVELVADATCAGAKVATEPGGPIDLPEQVAQVTAAGALSTATDLVTISAGGNDVGFGAIAGVCSVRPADECAQAIASSNATALPALDRDLDVLFDSINAAAPNATVAVTGYPHLFSPEFGNPVIPLESQIAFNAGTDSLNAVIRSQAEAHGHTFVDLVPRFQSRGLGAPKPWITFSAGAEDNLHPTAKGYKAGYFPAVRSAVNISQLQR